MHHTQFQTKPYADFYWDACISPAEIHCEKLNVIVPSYIHVEGFNKNYYLKTYYDSI